jgi:hypothetical protein
MFPDGAPVRRDLEGGSVHPFPVLRSTVRFVVRFAITVALVASTVAVAVVVAAGAAPHSQTATNRVVNLSDLPTSARSFIIRSAVEDGVDPASVTEVTGFGAGEDRKAALVGSAISDGSMRVSFFQGFGMTPFEAIGRVFQPGDELAVREGYTGPRGASVSVDVVGAARPSVARIKVMLTSGLTVDAPLVSAGDVRFFVYAGNTAATFPQTVFAYNEAGSLLATHQVPTS